MKDITCRKHQLPWARLKEVRWQDGATNCFQTGHISNGFLAESTLNVAEIHTFFTRIDRADKNELFTTPNPLANQIFGVYETFTGYIFDFPAISHFQFGLGGLMTLDFLPNNLNNFYGSTNTLSYVLFGRIKII